MRAVHYHEHGGPEVLQVAEIERPEPGPDEVRIEVRAASVNPVDTKIRGGLFGSPSFPATPGGDGAGIVDGVGEQVEGFDVGDRVFFAGVGQSDRGTFAEYVALPTTKVAHAPERLSFEEAAALGNVGGTALTALVDLADLEPTEYCLVHGGSGGVGHVAVQIARAVGALPIATAGSEAARDRVRELGAVAAFDYAAADLAEEIREATDGDGVDVILDHRLDDYLELDLSVAAQHGRIVTITGDVPATGGAPLRNRELTIRGMSMGNRPERQGILRRLATLVERGELTPIVAETYELSEVAEAHRDVLAGGYVGKLVVRV